MSLNPALTGARAATIGDQPVTRPSPDDHQTPVLKLIDISRTYGNDKRSQSEAGTVAALRNVNLSINRGEFLTLVGPSGSGKSTLMHVMGTLDLPSSGTMFMDGVDISSLDDAGLSSLRARKIGFVFQQFFLSPVKTALDNVADGLLYTGTARSQRRDAAARALTRVGLADRLYHKPNELSGGERQRVAIARAVVGDPPLLLADEPTGNLDSASGAGVMELLNELNGDSTTVVVVTHDRDLATQFPRRIELQDGRVISDVTSPS